MDLLLLVDTGHAPMPPSRVAALDSAPATARPRAVAAVAATVVLAAAGAWVGFSALAPGAIGGTEESPDQEVLGGFGAGTTQTPLPVASAGGAASAAATHGSSVEDPSPSGAASPSDAALPTNAPSIPAPPTARPSVPPPPPTGTPAPTQRPSRTASPTSSPTPTQPPTPEPTPEPTPPPLDDCEDGIDNDGDSFVDLEDPGCTLFGDEASA
jgi:hypothetical protein